ncbi:MAG: ATP-binding cassette domain-containing protein [Planctomycetota bacterium]
MIKVNGLTKSYGPNKAVDNISFEVTRGEIVGFLGPNGAGKTTTMRVITTYIPKDTGQVEVAGSDLDDDPVEIRRRIGYLPESAPLYLDMGVVDYLKWVATIRGIASDQRMNRIKHMVDVCGLEKVLDRDIGQLSKGFRQRVGLASTLMHDPDILVLDEPTTGLDPNQIVEIRELIREIGKQKTIIFSTHILPEVQATCSRVIIISGGKLVADGTPDDLVSAARGQAIYRVSIKASTDKARAAIEKVKEITRIENTGGAQGYSHLKVVGASKTDGELGEQIFQAVVQSGLVMTELSKESMSLEEVFTKLTVGGNAS